MKLDALLCEPAPPPCRCRGLYGKVVVPGDLLRSLGPLACRLDSREEEEEPSRGCADRVSLVDLEVGVEAALLPLFRLRPRERELNMMESSRQDRCGDPEMG
jgi:hypothetical protein